MASPLLGLAVLPMLLAVADWDVEPPLGPVAAEVLDCLWQSLPGEKQAALIAAAPQVAVQDHVEFEENEALAKRCGLPSQRETDLIVYRALKARAVIINAVRRLDAGGGPSRSALDKAFEEIGPQSRDAIALAVLEGEAPSDEARAAIARFVAGLGVKDTATERLVLDFLGSEIMLDHLRRHGAAWAGQ